MCALFLKVNPMGKGIVQESSTGDETIIASQNDLGTYYLNGMYTMRLTAYMLPDFWHCVDWADHVLQILSCILCILLLGLAIYVGGQQYRKRKTADTLTKSTYRFGKYIFDSVNHTLTYEGEKVSCTPQAAKLLLGFAKSSELFLTNDEIAEICGWPLSDLNLGSRRRKAISLLGKLFEADDSIQILLLPERKGYQIVISK
jgi:DNA-binding winged helix-turn-helix (wHTH) protein